jgi:putative spermidine/putrescine transport system permease protein
MNFFYRYPRLGVFLLLAAPMAWLLVVYISPLYALLEQSRYSVNEFTMLVERTPTWDNYESLREPANQDIIKRTLRMSAAVTATCAVLAFFPAYYLARVAKGRLKSWLYLAVVLPLWSSYLVRVYTWKLILSQNGVAAWFFEKLGLLPVHDWILKNETLGGSSLSTSTFGLFIVFVYIWLPYMILPITVALERVPQSLMDASSDLGARPWYTFLRVTLPLSFPGIVAGSIFTFSLTLGDYIVPKNFGGSQPYIGSNVESLYSIFLPQAATFTVVALAIMIVYLLIAKRLGAFDAL